MNDWKIVQFKDIYNISSGKSTKYSKENDMKYEVFGSNGKIGTYNEYNFDDGFLLGRVGAVGTVHKISHKVWASDNTITIELNPNAQILKGYSQYLLTSLDLSKYATKTAQPLLTQKALRNIEVYLPPINEQQKIATILSSVDEIVSKTETIIEQTNQVKSGVMRKLFKEGIRNSDFKETKLGKIPYDWEIVRQGDIAKFYNGRAFKQKEFIDEGTPVVRIQNLKGGKNYVYSNLELEKNKYIDKGDLVYAWSATFGPYIWEGDKAIYHYHIWKIECSENILKKYFYYKLHSLSNDNTSHKKGAVFAHLTKSFMESYEIALPPLKEQQEIVDTLESIDNKISSELSTLNKLKLIKEGLMQQLLTGKIRVPLNEHEEVPQ